MRFDLRTFILIGACAVVGGCSSGGSLAATDSYAQHYVGAWRVAVADDPQTFSDYMFRDAGLLTHLRSVRNGQTVDEMQGAGLVRGNGPADPSCVFANDWYSTGPTTLVVGGACTDGATREIELDFADATARTGATVTAAPVGDDSVWMRPAAWRFQRCDVSACH